MGCFQSSELVDFDTIQPVVLRNPAGVAMYSGTTERGRYQTMGNAELLLTEECFYSQVTETGCCGDHGFIRIPIRTIKNVRQQSYFNGRYRVDHPHMVVTYIVSNEQGDQECQAGWQMTNIAYNQWKESIERLINQTFSKTD